jgi:DNA modification methylase
VVAVTALVLRGDARALPLPDASVDLIVTSPPYWALRDYRDGEASLSGQIGGEPTPQAYIAALLDCTAEWMRVLKPEGSMFVVLGDKYSDRADAGPAAARSYREDRAEVLPPGRSSTAMAPRKSRLMLPERYRIGCVDQLGLTARAVIIWSKPSAMPERVTDRVRAAHEDIVHFTKRERYFAAVDEIRTPASDYARRPGARRATPPGQRRRAMADTVNPLGALPGSVWEIATQPLNVPDHLGVDHYAAFPIEIPRRIIRGWSPVAGVIVDPFGGTGTTALVASALGRRGVTVDRSADYCRIAQWRTTDPGERARVLGLPKPQPPVVGQDSLFEQVIS